MSRPHLRLAAVIQICLVLFTGCHPTQPFFVRNDESLANYLAQSMDVDYADVYVESLPEATQTHIPLGPDNLPKEFVDLTLEDCINMAMANTKIIRVVGGLNQRTGSVGNALISAQPGQMPSAYDPAITATTSNTQPLAVDSQGTRIAPRGMIRANQVGGVEDALSEFDAQFSAIFGYNTTDRPRNVGPGNIFNPQFFQGVDANSQAAISKRNANGTITTARFTTVYSRNNIPAPNIGREVASDYTAALELQINQPLLRGRGTLVNRIPVVLARINEDIALHEFEINIRNLVQSVEHAYWDLYCGYRSYDVARQGREAAQNLWQVAEARSAIGKENPQAKFQAEAVLYSFDNQMKAALFGSTVPGFDPEGIVGREMRLRELIGWGASDGRLIRPADEPSLARVNFNWQDVVGEALTRNVELRRQKWAIKQDELELISARNQILAQLDFVGFYRWLGVGDQFASADRSPDNFPAAGTNALQELTSGDYQELGARLELTPQAFGKRRAMANIQNAEFQIKKTNEELREKEVLLVFRIHDALRQIQNQYDLVYGFQREWATISQEIDIYQAQIDERTGNLALLLDQRLRAEQRRTQTEVQYYNAVCEYNKWITNLHVIKGSILDLNAIELQEGAWVDKAYWDAEERARERAGGLYFDYGYTRPEVVSNGPVPQGGLTEGNISDTQAYYGQPAAPEEVDAEEAEESEESRKARDEALESILDRESPTAGYERTNASAVRTASATQSNGSANDSTVRAAEDFNWGTFGSNARPEPAVISTGTRHSIANPADRPARSNGLRSTDSGPDRQPTNWSPRPRQ